MSDYQQIVDNLRLYLQAEECELNDELKELAKAYSEAARELNEPRLRRCGHFLRQGLWSEAIQLAETEPNALELLACLDFPELDQLADIISAYGLPRLEPLLLDVAEELNEAYAIERPMQRLLGQHRLLALGRAPLVQRLGVLRKIAPYDSDSAVWADDIRVFERARHGEIEAEASVAASKGDAETLRQLRHELEATAWLEKPSKKLLHRVAHMTAAVVEGSSRRRLQELVEELRDAHNALDIARARLLRREWDALATPAKLDERDPLALDMEPIFAWITDEDQRLAKESAYLREVASLERALNADMPRNELERRAYKIHALERSIPEPLATLYRNRIDTISLGETRQRRLVLSTAVILLLLVGGSVAYFVRITVKATEIKRLGESVSEMIKKDRLTDARALLESSPALEKSERGVSLLKELGDAERQEIDRKSAIDAQIQAATQTNNYDVAKAALEKARAVAKTGDEKLKVASLENDWERRHKNEAQAVEGNYLKRIEGVNTKLATLAGLMSSDPLGNQAEQLVDEIGREIETLKNPFPKVRPELQSQAKPLAIRLKLVEEQRAVLKKKNAITDRMTHNALIPPDDSNGSRQLSEYAEALNSYAADFSNEDMAKDFKLAAKEMALWQSIVEWDRLIAKWRDRLPGDKRSLPQRRQEFSDYLTKHATGPLSETATAYRAYLTSMLLRYQDDAGAEGGAISALESLFADRFVADIHTIKSRKGLVYYLNEKADFSGKENGTLIYLTDQFGQTSSKSVLVKSLESDRSHEAPQVEMARKANTVLSTTLKSDWNGGCKELVKIILNAKDVDPILRVILLKHTLEYAADGNTLLQAQLAGFRTQLENAQIDVSIRWMDPERNAAEEEKKRAVAALDQIQVKDLEPAWNKAAALEHTLNEDVFKRRFAVGWLKKGDRGVWQCQTEWKPDSPHPVFVVYPAKSVGSYAWIRIGQADQKSIVINTADQVSLCQGRLVFVVASQPAENVTSHK